MDVGHDHKVRSGLCLHAKTSSHTCEACSVVHSALCRALDKDGLAELNRISFRKRFVPGSIILRVGDPVDWCGVIVSGIAKLTKTTLDGRQQIVALQFPAEFIGQPFDSSRSVEAEAATAAEVCCFPRAAFDRVLSRDPALGRVLVLDTMKTLDTARDWLLVLGRKTAEEKVASFLLHVADRMAAGELSRESVAQFELPLSRDEIGEFLGLRIETVSRQFSSLKSDGVITTTGNRMIEILQPAELQRRAERELP